MARLTIAALVLSLAAACAPPSAPEAAPAESTAPAEPAAAAAPADAWIGQWNGVEGTYLKIEAAGAPGQYTLNQGTLDGVKTYQGAASGEAITFSRTPGGPIETVRAGTGDETGLKWLAGKSNCLVIKAGEGYCRD
jgi:hypothetical protein